MYFLRSTEKASQSSYLQGQGEGFSANPQPSSSVAPNQPDGSHSEGSDSEELGSVNADEVRTEPTTAINTMAMFTQQQFQQILAHMGRNRKSFTDCSARFEGQHDPAKVEEFIAAVSIFKEIENISDAEAIRGMPLLLGKSAAIWWTGVK